MDLALPVDYTPRFTCIYNLSGTAGTRLASGKVFRRIGSNFQNWDKVIRHQITADEGKDLCQIDQAGADALIVAWECEDRDFRALFRHGIKPHIYVAMHIFWQHWVKALDGTEESFKRMYLKCPIGELTKAPGWKTLSSIIKSHETYYYLGKKTCHSCNYGMYAKTFAMAIIRETQGKVVVTPAEAERFINAYHRLFPEIHVWHRHIDVLLKKRPPILYDLFGYPFYVTANNNDKTEREAYSAIPRNTVATITNMAFTEIWNKIADKDPLFEGVDLLQNGHDSILLQGPSNRIKEIGVACRGIMEKDLVSSRGEKFKMRTGIGYGKNWGPYHAEVNPEGINEE